jgi:dihydrofolate reductase
VAAASAAITSALSVGREERVGRVVGDAVELLGGRPGVRAGEQMRKVTASLFSSLDGVVEAPNEWPTSTDEPFASWINRTPKYVASSTLHSVEEWPNSTLIKGSVADFLARLRQQEGGTIGTAGSPSLVRSLLDQGLLDELTLLIHPVVAGGGRKRLFAHDAPLTKLELIESQPTSSGVLIATYRPVR